ncbi:MAG: polyamine aminopropyltransferase [Betaproteobacteria bacterium]|nr:polyamine aminopropyltransferase [Betaproteobacteria bacterium]
MNFFARWLARKRAQGGEPVYVSERHGVRSLHIGSDTVQSAMRIARPYDLELSYTRSMMAFLLFNERPRRVLMVGLGGGSLAKFVYHRMPWVSLEVVEVDPRVVAIARQYFHVPPDDDRFTVRIGDGAEHLSNPGTAADVIVIDGYDGEAQVETLCSGAFYEACLARLRARGVLVVNLWGSDRRFNEYVECVEATFPAGTLCLPAQRPGNIIALAFRDSPGNLLWDELGARARALEDQYGLEFGEFVRGLRRMNRCDAMRLYA